MDKSPKIDFNREQQDIAIVKLVNNKRYVEDIDSSVSFMNNVETEISPQNLKSKLIKQMLIDGDLRVVKGEIVFQLKNASFVVRANEGGLYYKEGDNIFLKDFATNQTVLFNENLEEKKEEKTKSIGEFF